MNLEVIGLSVSTQKATPNETPQCITLTQEGIKEDRHAGPGVRQVSVMAEEHAQLSAGGAPGANKENILLRGLAGVPLALMDHIHISDVILEVTELGAKVAPEGRQLCPPNFVCGVSDYGIFTRVLRGGEITIGDSGEYRRRCMRLKIITLSDRASSGKYEDRSGPKVEEMMTAFADGAGWDIDVERLLIPDDGETLRNALIVAREESIEVVITTGGTGIAPRDCTPETVLPLSDKVIPGVMEHARWKYGKDNPLAYLSRSVAVCMGGTLVYALPGSVKAVEEYMSEILRTLEHLLLTLRGLKLH